MEEKKKLTGRKLEMYVNLKYRQAKVLRPINFLNETFRIDPRSFFPNKKDWFLSDLIKKEKLRVGISRVKTNCDDTMKKCMEWIMKNTEYTRDRIDGRVTNNWQLPAVTAQRKKGDCEDLALLLIGLAIAAGIPYYRLKIVSGTVQKDPKAPTGGHAWVLYLRESDNEWEVWEGTSKSNGNKGLAKDLIGKSWYKKISWTANAKHCFSQKDISEKDGGDFI